MISLLREAGWDEPILIHGALEKLCRYYAAEGIALGQLEPVAGRAKADLKGRIVLCPPSATADVWARRFADPVTAFASGWMRVRARARQRGAELPLVVSDHADWDDLCETILDTEAEEVWVTHGQEDALVHWCSLNGIRAKPLNMIGYGDEGEPEDVVTASPGDAGGGAQ
jgi:putative mRNA 3-end processing factor